MRINSKRKTILGVVIALLAILLFWLGIRFIDEHNLLDEQYGDTGDWGDVDEDIDLTIGDVNYLSDDDIDTFLLIGTDAGSGDLGEKYSGTMADFLVLLLVDNTTQRFAFIQVDRNSIAPIKTVDEEGNIVDYEKQQICVAHWYGEDEAKHNYNTVLTLSNLLGGLRIDDYYTINMADIGKINNAIGGVTVNIEEDMTNVDPEFVQGTQVHLTDDQAEKFVRARMDVGDGSNKGRMSRQTQYMQNAYSMIIGQLRDNPEYVNDLYDQLRDNVETSGDGSEISRLTNHMIQYANLGILQLDGTTKFGDTQGDGIEHEEFYVNEDSIVSVLGKVMDLYQDDEE